MSKPRERLFKKLPVRLSDDELSQRSDELATTVNVLARLKAEKSDVDKGFNEEIKTQQGHAEMLAISIETRQVERDVECEVHFDIPKRLAVVMRTDTKQVISSRALTDKECQLILGEEVDELSEEVERALKDYERQIEEEEESGENGD